ncbi:MAG: DsbA family protein, partial [Desulfobulbaceae bacterium]|nr:DsbA family protein [Desulfobulbaceae bacterium]
YTDYLCFQCYKMHFFLRRLIAEHPDNIRLVHHNFPLDNQYNPIAGSEPYHVGAGKMALVAIRLAEHDKFWEVHDQLYKIAREGNSMDLQKIGKEFGINANYLASAFYDPALLNLLKKDIYKGLQHGMTATPSFVIEEKTYFGTLPTEVLDQAIK